MPNLPQKRAEIIQILAVGGKTEALLFVFVFLFAKCVCGF